MCVGTLAASAARGDTAFAAWWSPATDSTAILVVARSNDAGRHWQAPVIVDSADRTRTGCGREPPGLFPDSLNAYVHVVYFMRAPEGPGVFYTHSQDGGATFHSPVPVVYGERPSLAAVASRGDTVAVGYEDPNSSVPQMSLALSRAAGHIFEAHSSISAATAIATRPAIALNGGHVAVAWYETARDGGEGMTVVRTGTLGR
jgi:hypothetical protein